MDDKRLTSEHIEATLSDISYDIAANIDADEFCLQLSIAGSADPGLRCTLAEHPNATPAVLSLLSMDSDEMVRATVAWNSKLPVSVARRIAEKDPSPFVRIEAGMRLI